MISSDGIGGSATRERGVSLVDAVVERFILRKTLGEWQMRMMDAVTAAIPGPSLNLCGSERHSCPSFRHIINIFHPGSGKTHRFVIFQVLLRHGMLFQ